MGHLGKYRAAIFRTAPQRQKLRAPTGPHAGALIGCTETSFAIAAMDTCQDGVRLTERQVRLLSGEWPPDPQSPGLNVNQLDKVAAALHIPFVDATGENWPFVVDRLAENRRLVAQLWYSDIGGTDIGHAIVLEAKRPEGILGVDPMKGRTWYDPADVRRGMERFGAKTGLPAGQLRFGYLGLCTFVAVGAK